jgi:cupin 2 domain-containing protein
LDVEACLHALSEADMDITGGNIFAGITPDPAGEQFTDLLAAPNMKIERIVSPPHSGQPGRWYDQDQAEWVLVIQGSAALRFEGESLPRRLEAGDFVHIAARTRHRVEWSDPLRPTIWLAVHYR